MKMIRGEGYMCCIVYIVCIVCRLTRDWGSFGGIDRLEDRLQREVPVPGA
jgi:hypothetical protein